MLLDAIPFGTEQPLTIKGVELFRLGNQRDSMGEEREWTQEIGDEVCEAYNSVQGKKHDAPAIYDPCAPIQIGHEIQDEAKRLKLEHELRNMAYGWLEKAYRVGDRILGDYKEVEPSFAQSIKSGRFKKRSISLYPPAHPDNPTPGKWNIRHVAYIPIPAVKGLSDSHAVATIPIPSVKRSDRSFKDSGLGFVEISFSEAASVNGSWVTAIANIFQNLRDRKIADEGLDEANQDIPGDLLNYISTAPPPPSFDDIAYLQSQISDLRLQLLQMDDDDDDDDDTPNLSSYSEVEDMSDDLKAELQKQQAELAQLRKELDAEKLQLAKDRSALEYREVEGEVAGLIKDGKLKVEEKDKTIKRILATPVSTEVDFGEGNVTNLRELLLQDLRSRPSTLSKGDLGTSPGNAPASFGEKNSDRQHQSFFDTDSEQLDARIKGYMAKNPDVSYSTAFSIIVSENG